MMIDDTYALAIYTSRGASSKQNNVGFFVCSFVYLCGRLFVCVSYFFPLFVFLVSLFYDDR